MPLLAIEHTIETKDFEKSVSLLGEIVETLWENGHHSAIMKYGDLLPDELIKKNADFCLYYAWILIIAGQIQKAEPLLEFALKITNEKILDKKSEKQEVENYRKLLGKIAVAFAHLNSNQHKPEKILVYCLTAMENLSDNDPLWLGWA